MNLVSPEINEYCEAHSDVPSELCAELERYTRANVPMATMVSGPVVGSVLGFLIRQTRAKRVLEFGCFTGYSALAMAERLPADGQVVTLDHDAKTLAIAQSFWDRSPHGKKIRGILGNARDTVRELEGTFDFAFIDADKASSGVYLDRALERLSPGGMVAVDNCLWSGRVLDSKTEDEDTRAIQAFNRRVKEDRALEATLLPVRDGVFVIRRRGD